MIPEVEIDAAGVRFVLDRQRRPTTPSMASLRRGCTSFWGLEGVSARIPTGSTVALIGPNGVGKSTLLRLLSGVLVPDAGRVSVRGKVGSLLAVSAGLMPRLTGRENSVLVTVLSGLSRRDSQAAVDEIRERSELGAAFDRPVSTYSQGMRARLGFCCTVQIEPDVLLLDEVHEAIDQSFRLHVEEYVDGLRSRGGILVAAGHDVHELSRLCRSALQIGAGGVDWIEDWRPDGASLVNL